MRTLAVFFLLAALPAAAQQPKITGLAADGALTWTNTESSTHCAIEWTIDLNWSWTPLLPESFWNMPVTSSAQNVELPLNALLALNHLIPEMDRRWDSHFFRIRAGTNSLPLPSITNWITFANLSTSVLQDVSIGTMWSSTATEITNVPAMPPGESMNGIALATPFIHHWDILMPLGEGFPSHGWYAVFTQDGVVHELGQPIFELGPAHPDVTVTVSNQSWSIWWDWLNWGGTKEY
jgi:hypothetical protein